MTGAPRDPWGRSLYPEGSTVECRSCGDAVDASEVDWSTEDVDTDMEGGLVNTYRCVSCSNDFGRVLMERARGPEGAIAKGDHLREHSTVRCRPLTVTVERLELAEARLAEVRTECEWLRDLVRRKVNEARSECRGKVGWTYAR